MNYRIILIPLVLLIFSLSAPGVAKAYQVCEYSCFDLWGYFICDNYCYDIPDEPPPPPPPPPPAPVPPPPPPRADGQPGINPQATGASVCTNGVCQNGLTNAEAQAWMENWMRIVIAEGGAGGGGWQCFDWWCFDAGPIAGGGLRGSSMNAAGYYTSISCLNGSIFTATYVEAPVVPPSNLTAYNQSPLSGSTHTTGTSISFVATVSNAASTADATNFPNYFEISGVTNLGANNLTLAGGASGTITSSAYTFSSAGTYQYRGCADSNGSGGSVVVESNESDNCSPWTGITVVAPIQCADGVDNDGDTRVDMADAGCSGAGDNNESDDPATADLTANPTTVVTNGASTLTWTSTNAGSCSGTGFNTGGATSGSVSTGALTSNQNYQVTCGSANDTASVSVTNPTVDINATPDRVNSGSSALVTWTTSQCTTVTVTKNGAAFSSAPTGTNVSSGPITTQTTFRASCDGNVASDTVIVNIVPSFEEF